MEPDSAAGGEVLPFARPRRDGALPSGDVTFVFTDIEGSTRLLAALGERFGPMLAVHRSIVAQQLAEAGGVLVNAEGDEMFFACPSAADAVTGVLAAQAAIGTHRWPDGFPLRIRAGLHTGPARPIGHSYIALAVHQAARICAAGHGGQVLASATTAALVERPGRDLGRFRLKDFDEAVALVQYDAGEHPPLKVVPDSVRRLVLPDTSFVGRDDELAEIGQLLDAHPLVMICGPGGAGKTRLAVEVASRAPMNRRVCVVELAGARNLAEVHSAVAAALDLAQSTDVAVLDLVIRCIAEIPDLLLVLDNCEQVLDPVAGLIAELLTAAPQARVLATSREPLGIASERVVRLAPLDAPTPGTTLDDLLASDAARLLVDRIIARDSGFRLEVGDIDDVVVICQRLDGSPLALELVAAQVAAAGLAAARRSVEAGATLDGGRGRPARHRSIEAALDWSYALVEADERVVWARLAVFVAPFRNDDAIAVAGADDLAPAAVTAALIGLVNKSVITRVSAPDGVRYRMHQAVREYGQERLREAGDLESMRDRHAEWATGFLDANYYRVTPPDWFAAFGVCRDDLVAAWHHLRDSDQLDLAAVIGGHTAYWDYFTGRSAEGSALLEDIATWPDGPHLAGPLIQAGAVIGRSQNTARARDCLERALRYPLEPRVEIAARDTLIEICLEIGDFDPVVDYTASQLAAPIPPDSPMAHAWARSLLGLVALCRGDLESAHDHNRRARDEYAALGQALNACIMSVNLAATALLRSDSVAVLEYATEAEAYSGAAKVADQGWVARMLIAATNPPVTPNDELRSVVSGIVASEMPLELGDFYQPLPVLMVLEQWRALAVATGAFATVYTLVPNPFPLLDDLLDEAETKCRAALSDAEYDELFAAGCADPSYAAILAALD